jgi:translation initiation factor 4A
MDLFSLIDRMTEVGSEVVEYDSFDGMDLSEEILRGIYANGFTVPSAIQKKGIVPIKSGHDLLAQAQSGTGKTGTFTIGCLSRIDSSLKAVQVLVLAPTRELSQQIEKVANGLSQFMKIGVHSATGGTNLREDTRAISRGCQFLVGTPGRIFDLMDRNILKRENIRVLVLDEADQMLEDRFKEQVLCILNKGFPKETRIALFSATMDTPVREVANQLLNNPVKILINPDAVPLDGIKQYFVQVEKEEWKVEVLADLYKQLTISQALIYCNSRKTAEKLAQKMTEYGYPLCCIHGEMEPTDRKKRMDEFRMGETRVMISTDLLARGIDVQQVSLVINYELPIEKESYIHRIGRAGRFGRKGVTINILLSSEISLMEELKNHYKFPVEEMPANVSAIMD